VDTYSPFYRRAFVVATVLILGYGLLKLLEPLAGALIWAALLAFLLYPLHLRLGAKLGGRMGLSATILTLLSPFVIIAPLSMLTVAFVQQVTNLIEYMRNRTPMSFSERVEQLNHVPVLGPILTWIRDNTPVTVEQIESWAMQSARSVLQGMASLGGNVVLGVVGTLIGFLLVLFLLYFFLRDGRDILTRLTRLIPLDAARRDALLSHLSSALRAVFFGTVVTALVQGALIGIGFALAGLPSPVVIGVLAAVIAFIPGTGPFLTIGPAVVYLAIVQRWGAFGFLVVWGIGVAICEQVLRPLLASRAGTVSTPIVFIGAIGGMVAFGMIGLLLGPVLLSLVTELLRMAQEAVDRNA
jgi:predicted PurR-regulated permease PerM